IRPHSEVNSQNDHVGDREKITNQDQNEFEQARGQVSASLMALSVSGNVTTLTVQVTNTGSTPVRLVAIAVHGNFTSQSCASIGSSSTTTSSQQDHQDSNTSSSTSTSTSSNFGYHDQQDFRHCYTPNEVVFVPVSSSSTATTTSSTSSTSSTTTTSNSCVSGQLSLVNMAGSEDGEYGNSLVVSPGQCMTLTFSGVVSFGHSGNALVPSTAAGQNYTVHVIASNGAEMKLSCTLPVSGSSCTATSSSQNNQGKDNQN
ncbi:MAG: hypothetical protein JRN20_21120, partial [Nitrososphaerota archaeon]|nr:hypothetical protein [Nitrososphaerota archaeon]